MFGGGPFPSQSGLGFAEDGGVGGITLTEGGVRTVAERGRVPWWP